MTGIDIVVFDYFNVISHISGNFFTAIYNQGLDAGVFGKAYYENCAAWETRQIDNYMFWENIRNHYIESLGNNAGAQFDSVDHMLLYENVRNENVDPVLLTFIKGIDQVRTLASNINPVSGEKVRSELESYFNQMFFSIDLELSKPDERFYRIMLEDLDIAPNKVCYVDDKQENINAAIKLGITGILFQNREQTILDLTEHGINPSYPQL